MPDETLPVVREITIVEELDARINLLPQEAYEALYFLACGYSVDEIIDEMFVVDKHTETINADYAKVLESENIKRGFIVLNGEEDKKELEEMLAAPLEKWRVFLHPSQRKIVETYYKGPVRILGGAGTGKTVVAMHRAKWLAKHIYNSQNERILFTTFTKNLANDIYDNLRKICEPVIMRRIEVVSLNQWVTEFLKSQGYNYRIIYDEELDDIWKNALTVKSSEIARPMKFREIEYVFKAFSDSRWFKVSEFSYNKNSNILTIQLQYFEKNVGISSELILGNGERYDLADVETKVKYKHQLWGDLQYLLSIWPKEPFPNIDLKLFDNNGHCLSSLTYSNIELKKLLEGKNKYEPIPSKGTITEEEYIMATAIRVPYGSREFAERLVEQRGLKVRKLPR